VSNEIAATILTLDGKVTRVPLPASDTDYLSVGWAGDKVVAGRGEGAIEIDPGKRSLNRVTSVTANRLSQSEKAQKDPNRAAEEARAIGSRIGGTDAIPLN
jgi:hypothetical protein